MRGTSVGRDAPETRIAVDDRITRLEEQVAFVQRHVEQLDDVVRDASDKVAALERDLAHLRTETRSRIDGLAATPDAKAPGGKESSRRIE